MLNTKTISTNPTRQCAVFPLPIIETCRCALEDKKAENIRILYLGQKSSLTDYYIIATGTSPPHLKALCEALETALKNAGSEIVHIDAKYESGWIVIDTFDVIIHLFTEEKRDYYRLETLWKDADVLTYYSDSQR